LRIGKILNFRKKVMTKIHYLERDDRQENHEVITKEHMRS